MRDQQATPPAPALAPTHYRPNVARLTHSARRERNAAAGARPERNAAAVPRATPRTQTAQVGTPPPSANPPSDDPLRASSRLRAAAVRVIPRAVARMPRLVLARPKHWRRRLLAMALVAALLGAAYFFWFRDSSFVKVERVEVIGLSTTPGADSVQTQLEEAAKRMTTLHLDAAALEDIVDQHPVVRSIELETEFPHALTIRVVENRPVALVSAGGESVPVAPDGTVLEGLETSSDLPVLRATSLPDGRRVQPGGTLDRVTVAAAAPDALRAKVESITIQPGRGYVAQLHEGPEVWLGGHARLELKWGAAAAVLAQQSSQGASYVDVRIPERAVAGGLTITEEPQSGLEEQTQAVPPVAETPDDPAATAVPDPSATTAPPVTETAPPAPETAAPTAPADPQPSLQP
jgi:cell division protein FtsQ